MRLSKMYMPTLKEAPSDAEITSHKLMVRSGMIRRNASGVYSYLPLGYRVVKKVEEIVREEMDKAGAQETLLPIIQPKELWEKTGRWEDFGPEMYKLKDRHSRDFCLGPTHEEYYTDLLKDEVTSFRQLPLNLYQIQVKYRDELRPRYGVIRSREFIMKDAYSFDIDEDGMTQSYEDMRKAYVNVFNRLDVDYRVVHGDSGAMGGSGSQEFMVISDIGEDILAYSEEGEYTANIEKAEVILELDTTGEIEPLEKVHTPGVSTIEELEEFLEIEPEKTGKMVIYETTEGEVIIGLVPGHRELNETKLFNAAGVMDFDVEIASDETIRRLTEADPGYSGPIGLKGDYRLYVDSRLVDVKNLVIGANEDDHHYKNANYGRDFKGIVVDDLLVVEEGDKDPESDGILKLDRGIEVGHIFQLGTKYSQDIGLEYADENQKKKPVLMGSYGIGVTRSVAAIIEQHSDDNGIIWPISVAPYQVIITMINNKNDEQVRLAEKLYHDLMEQGYEVLLDDRRERPGVKFIDRDLIGIPLRITVGRDAKDDIVEFSTRKDMENTNLSIEQVFSTIEEYIESEKARNIY